MCGDWNISLNPDFDTFNYTSRDRRWRSRRLVNNMCQELNLHDVWREMNGDRKQFTWRKRNPVKCARLDFFLVSDSILNNSLSCEILPGYRSDHSRVSLRLNLSEQSRGRGLWKLNCSLLKDLSYLQMVKEVIHETITGYACPLYSDEYLKCREARQDIQMTVRDDLFLETLLMKIRSRTISYSIQNTKERTEKEKKILSELQILESLTAPTSDDMEKLGQKQTELQNIRSTANEGRIIRSRARWYEEGEKGSSSYFLKLERRNFESKLISSLTLGERVVNDPNEILTELRDHYAEVYSKSEDVSEVEINSYLEGATLPKLSNADSQSLEKDITVKELGATLMKFDNNRSPGSDGFPYEFYKVFWGEIKYFVYRSLNYGLMKGELSITQREGLITLVPKPSKPRNLISSWRPITLLNSTSKILAGTVANRLKMVLDSVIHPDQTVFFKNRFIGENIRVTYDILWETFYKNKKGLLLSVDFKTAFDVMSWNFLEKCLKKLNFGEKFIEVFWCLHRHTFSRIIYNGHLSSKIQLERGCRQGDPISCYFFIIGAEALANKIRQNRTIRGIKLREGQTEIKVIQYADDTTFFLDGSEESLRAVFGELGWFAKFSGLKPNVSKCNAMWIGNKSFSSDTICAEIPLNWVVKLKLLGVVFSPHCRNIVDENVTLKKESILRTIGMWQNRHLSLMGRITIAKSLLLSQITHVMSSLPDPSEKITKEINKILFKFVWGSKRNPIKRIRLCQPVPGNGLAMIDISSYIRSLKIKWIKRLITGNRSSWSALVPSKVQSDFIWNFGCVALNNVMREIHNPFWRDVVAAWILFSKTFKTPEDEICNENIFNSDYTKFKNSRYASWEGKGVRIIGDLFEGNKLLTWEIFKYIYNIPCNYLEYHGLLHSLPRALKKDQACGWYQQYPSISARIHFLLNNTSYTKCIVVGAMKSNRSQDDLARIERKWSRDIGDFEPFSVYIVKNSVSATCYTSFQFKLVMRILTTNSFLHLIRYREDDLCTFCKENSETLVHLLLSCPSVERFWNDISRYLLANGLGLLGNKTKIFGDSRSSLITHVVTVAKVVIYDVRYREIRLSFNQFRAHLKRDYETERFIAVKNNKVDRFNKKWNALMSDLGTRDASIPPST